MPKIVAHYGKKIPIGEYSNQQFEASIEAEIDEHDPPTLKAALRRLFQLTKESVEEQFRSTGSQNGHGHSQSQTPSAPQSNSPRPAPANGVQHGRFVPATASQRKAIFAICKSLGLDHSQYGIDRLSVKQASQLIDELKSQQAGSR
jgi:hypothetical protein